VVAGESDLIDPIDRIDRIDGVWTLRLAQAAASGVPAKGATHARRPAAMVNAVNKVNEVNKVPISQPLPKTPASAALYGGLAGALQGGVRRSSTDWFCAMSLKDL